jgi:type II secretory pathway component GspD/PulD (secretin)
MKTTLTCTLLLGLSLTFAALAQEQPPAAQPAQPAQPPAETTQPAPVPLSSDALQHLDALAGRVPAQDTPAPATDPAPAEPAPASSPEAIETPVVAQAAAPPAAASAEPAPTPAAEELLPLIMFEDAPLHDAIKTLARQAGINFLFDPKLTAPGPDGKPPVQPNVSIRFENVTAQQALTAVLDNYGLQLVMDNKTKTGRITTVDPAAPPALITKVIQLKHTNPTNMVAIVKPTLTDKRSQVTFDNRTSKLIVVATESELEAVDKLIETLDLPTRQVLIEARIYETARNPSSIKGIDWTGTLKAQGIQVGNNQQDLPTTSGESLNRVLADKWPKFLLDSAKGLNPGTAFLNADGVNTVLSFLNSDSDSEVVATPRAVTLDNEKAVLSVTRAFPIINTTPGSANSPAGAQILYTNLGTILEVTPRISANDTIALKVVPEVSNIDGKDIQTVNGLLNEANIYAIRRIEANVVVPSGNTLVMGGLISDTQNKADTKVPVLGDAPLIGGLFRSKSRDHKKSNLLIFVTPTIIADDDFQPHKTDFLKTPMPEHAQLPTGWWNTAKPHPWTEQQRQAQARE